MPDFHLAAIGNAYKPWSPDKGATSTERTTPMASIFCGIDFHKRTSTIFATDGEGRKIESVTIQSDKLRQYLSNRRDWKIAIEASGGVHHIVSGLLEDGHEVVMINPNQFRGIAIGGIKTDDRDAVALAHALRVGFVPTVHHKSIGARRLSSLLVSREIVVRTRVGIVNHVRATLREYGLLINAGCEAFDSQVENRIAKLDFVPIQNTLRSLVGQVRILKAEETRMEQALKELTREDLRVKHLQSIPGVGPMTSYAMIAVTDDISRFKDANQFTAYLGLVPSVTASGDKRMMGSITRSGSEMLRRYFVHGARAWMRYSPEKGDRNRIWAEQVKGRRGMNKSVVALARRMARIAFAVMRDGSTYRESVKNKAA